MLDEKEAECLAFLIRDRGEVAPTSIIEVSSEAIREPDQTEQEGSKREDPKSVVEKVVQKSEGTSAGEGSLPDESLRLRSGELTLEELFNGTEIGKAMNRLDREALRVGAVLARWFDEPLNSMGVMLGYLLTASVTDRMKSETALTKAVWWQYVAQNPEVPRDEVEMRKIYLPNSLPEDVEAGLIDTSKGFDSTLSEGFGAILVRSLEVAREAGRTKKFSTRHLLACMLGPGVSELDPKGKAKFARSR